MSVAVLIVDDDKAVRFFHQVIVTQCGLSNHPLCFGNAKDVLQYFDENYINDDIYLLLLDINMPVMDGWDLLDIIENKPYKGQVYVVMVTSSVDRADREKANRYSMVLDVIEKPITDDACKKIFELSSVAQHL